MAIGAFGELTNHTIIANGGYDRQTARQELGKGLAKIIFFGVSFLANPDLPKRFEINSLLNSLTELPCLVAGKGMY